MKANRYYRMKAQHRCTACGKQDDRTAAGKTQCASCAEKSVKANRRYQAEHKEQLAAIKSAANAQRYYRLQENHCCVHCGSKLPEGYYYVKCEHCREYDEKYRQLKKKDRLSAATLDGQNHKTESLTKL